MNKKIVTLIIVILISFCFLSIVVAENATHDDNHATDHNTTDKNKITDKNKTDNGSKKNYILAKGNGNDIKFSDGFRGFRLDYSKPPASSGDEFKHVPTSKVSNSNTLKLAIIECYKQGSTAQIGKIITDFIKTGSSNTPVGKAVAASHEKVSDHVTVKINDHTVAVFQFEVLKSVSGNKSDYFAYKVSFITTSGGEGNNQTNNLTNVPYTTNNTNITSPLDNETNATFLKELFDYLAFLANILYDSWGPIIDTIINKILMIVNALVGLANLFEGFMAEINSLIDAIGKLLMMLGPILKEINGILKLLTILVNSIVQLLNLIGSILNLVAGIISAIISIIQQIIGLVVSLINFLVNLINQILALIQAILDLLKATGSSISTVIGNAGTLINAFVIITIGAYIYNNKR